jgi:hypothetical protein
LEEFDFAQYGPHMFPQHPSPTNPTTTIAATITAILAFQGVKLQNALTLTLSAGPAEQKALEDPQTRAACLHNLNLAVRVTQVWMSECHECIIIILY